MVVLIQIFIIITAENMFDSADTLVPEVYHGLLFFLNKSVVRAKEIFKVDFMIVVSQKNYLTRSVFLDNSIDIQRNGVVRRLTFREYFALAKSFYGAVFRPKPHFFWKRNPYNRQK